jgi:hypothetical protein
MASNATNPTPGRTAWAIHWLFPSQKHLAITIAVEMALSALGLPLWARLLLAAIAHLIAFALAWLS